MAISRGRRRYENRLRLAKAVRGTGRFRKFLRRLPDEVRAELVVELRVTGRQMRQAVQARTLHRSGKLHAGITERVLPRSLRLQIGLLGRPSERAGLFYGRIQDGGRTAQVVRVTRRAQVVRQTGNNRNGNIRATTYATGKGAQRRGRGKLNLGQIRHTGDLYQMQVAATPAKEFVTGRYPDLRRLLNENLRGIFRRSLNRLSGGSDE